MSSTIHSMPRADVPVVRAPAAPGHLPTLDALRGIAALSVCWFHFTNAQFSENLHYHASGKYGWLGVQTFFVISGFVIPFSLFRARYKVGMFFRFMLKRIARLDPPYLASIVFVLSGLWVSSLTPGHAPYRINWLQVFAHLGYINAFTGMAWLQMSYWSLAIEFQYYLLVGLIFPLLALKGRIVPVLLLGLTALGSLANRSEAFLPHYLPLFATGFLIFRHLTLAPRWAETLTALFAAFALTIWADGWPQALAGLGTALVILFLHWDHPVLNFFGNISYSVYLLHVFVGQIVFGLAMHAFAKMPWLSWCVQFLAVGLVIAAAYIFFRFVELPSRKLSSRITYKSNRAFAR